MIKFLLVFFSLSICAQVKYIDKGTEAPYSGYLFTPAKTIEIRKELLDKDKLTIFNKTLRENIQLQNKIIITQKDQVKILAEQNTKLAQQIDSDNSVSNFEKALWFGLGIAASSLAVYGASQLAR